MRSRQAIWMCPALLAVLAGIMFAQEKAATAPVQEGLLKAAEVGDKLFPDKVFFRGQSATVQGRNSGGVRYADGFLVTGGVGG